MEEQSNGCLSQRKFGFAELVWEVENYFCETYKKKWEICSPEFSVNGFISIKWKFILRASIVENDEENVATIHLERPATGDVTIPVRVFWNLSCTFETEFITICEKESVFDAKGSISWRIKDSSKLLKILQDISTKEFKISAIFLVTSLEDNASYGRSNDMGLRSLSQDIGTLYSLKDYNDLTIYFGKTPVEGHKAIISAENSLLCDIIKQYEGDSVIPLAHSDEKSAGKILNYLYTGNVDYVLRIPSISLDEAIHFFGVKELEEYYMKDKLMLRTKYEANEFYYKWIIADIKNKLADIKKKRKEDFFLSPKFGDRVSNMTFELRLVLNTAEIPDGNMSIFLEGPFPQKCQELFIRFDIISIYGKSLNLNKTVRWTPRDGRRPGIEDFISWKDFKKKPSIAGNETLSILCSVFVPADSTSLSVVRNRSCLLSNIDCEEHYALFSKRMESLFSTGMHSDLTIKCGNRSFRVHRCILNARSQVFAEAVRGLEDENSVFAINDVDPDILEIVLRYIYSGVLKGHNLSQVPKIYTAGVDFSLLSLKNQCAKILEENLDILNVFDYLFLAYARKETKLKLAAFKYLVQNKNVIRDQVKWEQFTQERDLYDEFKEYVRNHVRNNPEGVLKLDDF